MLSGLGVCFCALWEKMKEGLEIFTLIQLSADGSVF